MWSKIKAMLLKIKALLVSGMKIIADYKLLTCFIVAASICILMKILSYKTGIGLNYLTLFFIVFGVFFNVSNKNNGAKL